jgi:hypothetical protein
MTAAVDPVSRALLSGPYRRRRPCRGTPSRASIVFWEEELFNSLMSDATGMDDDPASRGGATGNERAAVAHTLMV